MARGSFVLGDGTVIAPEGAGPLRTVFDSTEKWGVSGTLSKWQRQIAAPVERQSRFVCSIALAFVPPLLEIVQQPNFGLSWWERPVWGNGHCSRLPPRYGEGTPAQVTGFMETWATRTVEGSKSTMMRHEQDSLLLLEESNLAGQGDDQRSKIRAMVFRLASGVQKVRFTQRDHRDASARVPQLKQQVDRRAVGQQCRKVLKAAEVRLFTVQARGSAEFGVFDRLPKRFQSSSEAVDLLADAANKFYGTAIRAFLKELVRDRARNPKRLRRRIRRLQDKFIEKSGVDPNDGAAHVTAKAFALIYAAAMLAQEYGVLPDQWKSIGPAILTCYRAHVEASQSSATKSPQSAIQRIREYARKHTSDLVHMAKGPLKMTDARFQDAFGFIRRGEDGKLELLVPPSRLRREYSDWKAIMQELRDQKYARTEGGDQKKLTTKVAIRKGRSPDRIYCIRIGSL